MYLPSSFDARNEYFETLAVTGLLRLILAFDREDGRYIGYLVCSLSDEKTGKSSPSFVREQYRAAGVGIPVASALAWFDEHGSVRNRISVADGNERLRILPEVQFLREADGARAEALAH